MSRGHGKLQRELLALIRAIKQLDTFQLCALAYRVEPNANGEKLVNDTQLAAVRRALSSLAREGLIVGWHRGYSNGYGANTPRRFWITPEEAERQTTLGRRTGFDMSDNERLLRRQRAAIELRLGLQVKRKGGK
jgi:hypothetical protein